MRRKNVQRPIMLRARGYANQPTRHTGKGPHELSRDAWADLLLANNLPQWEREILRLFFKGDNAPRTFVALRHIVGTLVMDDIHKINRDMRANGIRHEIVEITGNLAHE